MWLSLAGVAVCLAITSILIRKWRMRILAEQRGEAIRTKRMMEDLTATEGWKFLMAAAEMQVKSRRNDINFKPTSDSLAENYMKGEASGIEMFMRIPSSLIDEAKAIIQIANQEAGEVDETSED